jgi:1-acyl-sn-glycerol-3-phosphate acyltransferase/protein-tyrosine phosphatase
MGHLHRFVGRTRSRVTGSFAGERSRAIRADLVFAGQRSALLSLLFLAVYGGCNRITAQRTDVGVWYFEWERSLPFWAPMIVPYLSIDLFFIVAPFLCRDRDEVRMFTKRVALAIAVAGVCFLSMPLTFAFDRPRVDGWPGALFQAFGSLDRPFNLFPSLHITLAVILLDTYWRRTSGAVRGLVATWFALIGVSTLLTYQHHVVDAAGGLALAVVVFDVVRPVGHRHARGRNARVAGYYLAGAAAGSALAVAAWPLGALLMWPAVSLTVVGAGYLGLGPVVFGKRHGRLLWSTRLLLWPVLFGQWASLVHYRRQCRPYDRVAPGVWIGRRLSEREALDAVEIGVTAVLDLTAEMSEAPAFARLPYRNLAVLDLTAPTQDQLKEAIDFISAHSAAGVVYVHCKVGYSRSAAIIGAYLLSCGLAHTTDDALAAIRSARPSIVVRPEARAAIQRFEEISSGTPSPHPRSMPSAAVAAGLAGLARAICGTRPRWINVSPSTRQRIYFANHTSHLDFLILWGSLPADTRARTRPVAKRDYWDRSALRRYLMEHVFRAVLVDRVDTARAPASYAAVAGARRNVERMVDALESGESLIVFPEGTRGDGREVARFRSGLYHVSRMRPDVELVPVWLENMHRILPKGEVLPVPLAGSVTFGPPIRLEPGEDKETFLARARHALITVHRPCTSPTTLLSRAS